MESLQHRTAIVHNKHGPFIHSVRMQEPFDIIDHSRTLTMTSPVRTPLADLKNKVSPPVKKQRTDSSDAKPSVSSTLQRASNSDQIEASIRKQILIREWLTLPQSSFCIHYDLGRTRTYRHPPAKNTRGFSMLEMAADKCPFELRMQELKYILSEKYPDGAGLLYIREMFEPRDPEYRHLPGTIKVTTLTQEQVGRLRVMIVDETLQDVMIPCLGFYERLPFGAIGNVIDHFEQWKLVYSKLRDYRAKFNQIFSFTFALHKFDSWMFRMERGLGRSKMVAGLATRWKNLFSVRTPEELDLDDEFSYPAILALLQSFKEKVESAPTYGDPKMIFKFD